MDYKNKIDFINQKIKYQLNAKGVDTLTAIHKYFTVPFTFYSTDFGFGQEWKIE